MSGETEITTQAVTQTPGRRQSHYLTISQHGSWAQGPGSPFHMPHINPLIAGSGKVRGAQGRDRVATNILSGSGPWQFTSQYRRILIFQPSAGCSPAHTPHYSVSSLGEHPGPQVAGSACQTQTKWKRQWAHGPGSQHLWVREPHPGRVRALRPGRPHIPTFTVGATGEVGGRWEGGGVQPSNLPTHSH